MTQRESEQQIEKLGAFEITNEMLKLARHNQKSPFVLQSRRLIWN